MGRLRWTGEDPVFKTRANVHVLVVVYTDRSELFAFARDFTFNSFRNMDSLNALPTCSRATTSWSVALKLSCAPITEVHSKVPIEQRLRDCAIRY